MKSKNVKVIDEHNIDRDANIMFAIELDGSEYVVYWISRDEESNNVFVSKVLKNIDGTYNMLNIDDSDKKKDVAEIVKALISNSVTDQNDKLVGTGVTLSNGKVAKIISVLFNKEQHINVTKTYITTVKKEVTKVSENYYNVIGEEKVEEILPAVTPVVESTPISVVSTIVETSSVEAGQPSEAVMPSIPVSEPTSVVEEPVVISPVVAETPVVVEPIVAPQPVVMAETITPIVETTPVVEEVVVEPIATIPTVETVPVVEAVAPSQPVDSVSTIVEVPKAPVLESTPVNNTDLVFNATKETNLNAALGEVASSTTIPVANIEPVREFGVENSEPTPVVAPVEAPVVENIPNEISKKAGFANSKFFMVVAVAFFLASCIFLGYEVYNYFQLVK